MNSLLKIAGQAVAYGGMILVIGYFADTPAYNHFDKDKARIRLAFAHGGKAKGGCRKPTAEELRNLARNMRRKKICSRERLPVTVEMDIDGKRVYSETLQPTGIRSDGPSRTYQGFTVAPGRHKIMLKLRDSDRAEGFDYVSEKEVTLKPVENYVIQFQPEFGGFTYRVKTK